MYCMYTSTSSFNCNCGFNLKLRLTELKNVNIIKKVDFIICQSFFPIFTIGLL